MTRTLPWQTPARNYYPLPKVLCRLGLSPGEIAVYSFLMYCENRATYQCYHSYRTIGEAVGMSCNTVAKYVRQLEEKGLIRTERTTVTLKDGRKRNGSLLYTILPPEQAVEQFNRQQLSKAEAAAERRRIQDKLARQPAVWAATGVCGILRLTLIFSLPICFGAILWKNARLPRVFKGFGRRRHTKKEEFLMDNNGKSRHSVWLSDEVWQEVEAFYKLDNCPTRNEFVEKALRQYCGRLHAERSVAYLPRALQEMLEGTLGVFGDRLGKMLFKLVVEHNMTNHLLGGDIDMTRDEYNKMRSSSVREVASTHGNISFRDVLLFHREE